MSHERTDNVPILSSLVEVGNELKRSKYQFTTITPTSHERILNRSKEEKQASDLRDVFGWNYPFGSSILPSKVQQHLENANLMQQKNGLSKSRIRFSTYGKNLFVHSAFPTVEPDAIFFGPDTYRYLNFIRQVAKEYPFDMNKKDLKVIDIGCGSGAGGIYLSQCLPKDAKKQVYLTDINKKALVYSRANVMINSDLENSTFSFLESDILKSVPGTLDFIVSNPPYMVDDENAKSNRPKEDSQQRRAYRDGGGDRGTDLAHRIVLESIEKLNPQGILALYTGVPILEGGVDVFWQTLEKELRNNQKVEVLSYEEIDPDVWGEELDSPSYSDVERLAVVGLVLRKL